LQVNRRSSRPYEGPVSGVRQGRGSCARYRHRVSRREDRGVRRSPQTEHGTMALRLCERLGTQPAVGPTRGRDQLAPSCGHGQRDKNQRGPRRQPQHHQWCVRVVPIHSARGRPDAAITHAEERRRIWARGPESTIFIPGCFVEASDELIEDERS